jgi:hypothetical protein
MSVLTPLAICIFSSRILEYSFQLVMEMFRYSPVNLKIESLLLLLVGFNMKIATAYDFINYIQRRSDGLPNLDFVLHKR